MFKKNYSLFFTTSIITLLFFTFSISKTSAEGGAPVVTVPTSSSKAPSSGFTLVPGAGGTYTLLAPIGTFFPDGKVDVAGGGLGGYLNGLYRAGIAIATGLALIMIVVGGLEYVSVDSIQGKSNGRERIKNALLGLLLALTSYIILRQINPNLLKSDLQVDSVASIGGIEGSAVSLKGEEMVIVQNIQDASQNALLYGFNPAGGVGGMIGNAVGSAVGGVSYVPGAVSPAGLRILASAKNNVGLKICTVMSPADRVATNNGKVGCAFALSKIMNDANVPVGKILGTAEIKSYLAGDTRRFSLVSVNSLTSALPGDIVVSPTSGKSTGHVGIVETVGATRIISNHSGDGTSGDPAEIQSNHSGTGWLNNYTNKKGLSTYLFRAR